MFKNVVKFPFWVWKWSLPTMNPGVPPSSLPLIAEKLLGKFLLYAAFNDFMAQTPLFFFFFFSDSPLFLCFSTKTGIGGSQLLWAVELGTPRGPGQGMGGWLLLWGLCSPQLLWCGPATLSPEFLLSADPSTSVSEITDPLLWCQGTQNDSPLLPSPEELQRVDKDWVLRGFIHLLPSRNCLPFHGSWRLTKINNCSCLFSLLSAQVSAKSNHGRG